MMHVGRGVLCGVLALALAGCGNSDGGDNSDAGPNSDAGISCSYSFSVTPTMLEAGPDAKAIALASVNSNGLSGIQSFSWSVFRGATQITPEDNGGDDSQLIFPIVLPGDYTVSISGDIGGITCSGTSQTYTVTDPNAVPVQYRLRLVPAAGQGAPIQERVITVAGPTIPEVALVPGELFDATLTGPGATPLAAYMRLSQVGGLGGDVETFANASGEFSIWLNPALHDVLVVPADQTLAPMLFKSVDVTQAPAVLSALFTVVQGDAVTGTVLDRAGAPLAGARVSLKVDGVPSTIATTDGSGAFTVYARTGGTTTVSVVPPAGSGLPQLELAAGVGLIAAAGTPLAIRYSAGLTSRAVSLTVTQTDFATPVPMAPVTWIADNIASAGTVTPMGSGALTATGRVRMTAMADGSGDVSGLMLPETAYSVLVEPTATTPAGELVALVPVDLSSGMPTPMSVQLSVGTMVSGTVRGDSQEPLGGIRVTASALGDIANSPTASASVVTLGPGEYTLMVVAGGSYDLRFESTTNTHGHVVESLDAPAQGMVARDVDMRGATALSSSVTISGVGAAGVSITALCFDCTGPEAVRPKAEAISASDGKFVLAIPTPKAPPPN